MSDSQFEDLGASTIMNEKLVLEVRRKEQMIKELNDKVCELQRQLIVMQSFQLANQSQLQRKNSLLKQLAADNTRLAKRLTNQEEQITKLKQELLATDQSIHETLSSIVEEKESLLKLNQELSHGLVKAEQILDEKMQELRISRLELSEKDKFAENLEIKLKELQAEKSHLQNFIKSLQQSSQMHLKTVSEVQQKLNSEKKKSQSFMKEINELNQTIMELEQNHLQATTKLNHQLDLHKKNEDDLRKDKDKLVAELIDLKQKSFQFEKQKEEELRGVIEKQKENLRAVAERQKDEMVGLEGKIKALTEENNNLAAKESKRLESDQKYLSTIKVLESTLKQSQQKCRKLQIQLDSCGQALIQSCQQNESLRVELKEMKKNSEEIALQSVQLKATQEMFQQLKQENSQLNSLNHQLAVSLEQYSEQLRITKKQLSLLQQQCSKKAIQDLDDQCTNEFVLLKIQELLYHIETQINACNLSPQEKKHQVDNYKKNLLQSIKRVFDQGQGEKIPHIPMKKNNNVNMHQTNKKKQKQQRKNIEKYFFDQLNYFQN